MRHTVVWGAEHISVVPWEQQRFMARKASMIFDANWVSKYRRGPGTISACPRALFHRELDGGQSYRRGILPLQEHGFCLFIQLL